MQQQQTKETKIQYIKPYIIMNLSISLSLSLTFFCNATV